MKKDVIAVGDSTELEIIFSTKVYKSRVNKSPKIYTNEGKGSKTVRITATVVPRPDSTYPLVMKPYKLDISQFGDKQRDEVKLTITNVSDQPYDLKMIDYPREFFALTLPETLAPGASAEVTLALTQAGLGAEFEKSFTLEVNDTQTTRYTIPVKRKIRGAKDKK